MLSLLIAAEGAAQSGGFIHSIIEEWYVTMPMILGSILGLGIFIERWWAIKKVNETYPGFHDDIVGMVNEGKFDQAAAASEGNFPGDLYGSIVRGRGRTLAGLIPVIDRKLVAEMEKLKRMIWILGSLGTLAPFIGLLGTVIGIMICFQEMAATGGGGIAVVGAGISAALIATAIGLAVGIASVAANNYLTVALGHLQTQLRNNAEELAEVVVVQASKAAPRRPAAAGA